MGGTEKEEVTEVAEVSNGAFVESLKRSNKEIKSDRATAIAEDAQLKYKRAVEDLQVDIRSMKRQLENMLDLSPDNVFSLKLANDFDAEGYVRAEMELGLKIRNSEIKLDIASKRYRYLFGGM